MERRAPRSRKVTRESTRPPRDNFPSRNGGSNVSRLLLARSNAASYARSNARVCMQARAATSGELKSGRLGRFEGALAAPRRRFRFPPSSPANVVLSPFLKPSNRSLNPFTAAESETSSALTHRAERSVATWFCACTERFLPRLPATEEQFLGYLGQWKFALPSHVSSSLHCDNNLETREGGNIFFFRQFLHFSKFLNLQIFRTKGFENDRRDRFDRIVNVQVR